jgi:UPF0271 protein
MERALRLSLAHGLRAGAHPSYPDRQNFGRLTMEMEPATLRASLVAQVNVLRRHAAAEGVELRHVKAHGALYNRAWHDRATAAVVASAVLAVDPALALFCPPGSAQERVARDHGLRVVREVFLDRAYAGAGLVARDQPGAMVEPGASLARQVRWLASIEFDTMCVHGDNPGAQQLLAEALPMLITLGLRPAPYPA